MAFLENLNSGFGANFWVNFEVYVWNNVVVNFGNNFSGSWQGGSHKTGKFVIYYAGYGTKRFFSLIFYLQGISSGFVIMSGAGLIDSFNISTKILRSVAS